MQVWRNCKVLSEQTSDSSALLNAVCLLKYVLNCEQNFSYFIFWSRLSVTGLGRVYCISTITSYYYYDYYYYFIIIIIIIITIKCIKVKSFLGCLLLKIYCWNFSDLLSKFQQPKRNLRLKLNATFRVKPDNGRAYQMPKNLSRTRRFCSSLLRRYCSLLQASLDSGGGSSL
jgi:hypothetical protein